MVTMPQQDCDSAYAVRSAVRTARTSGLVVFSSTRKVLYVNKAALALLMRLNRKENGHSANHAIPGSVDRLLEEMLLMLRMAGRHHGWTELTTRRLTAAQDQPIWVRAFGIPGQRDDQRSLIIITMQETPPPS